MTIQERLLASFDRYSKNVAIEVEEMQITYGDLHERSSRIARFLNIKVPEPETKGNRLVVGVLLSRRSDIITAVLGVLKARSIFVVLDHTHPVKRLSYLTEDLKLDQLITDEELSSLAKRIIPEKAELCRLEDINSTEFTDPVDLAFMGYDPEDSIYVYYTSGSTGMPKGIEGKNSSLVQFLDWEINTFRISSNDRFSQLISPVFDAFLRDVFVPLLSGGTICIPSKTGQLKTPEETTAWLDEKEVNVVHCVPSVFKTFTGPSVSASSYSKLGLILLSGEKIVPASLKPWYALFGERIQLVNLYGTTETTMIRACYAIQPADQDKVRMPVGKAIDDTQLLVLDEHQKKVARLITGDLYIASDYLTKGYWNRPEDNTTAFQSLRLEDGSEVRAFKTGDKARWLTDGNLDLLGRDDNQIKLLGMRVELDEIEVQVHSTNLIKEAVVLVDRADDADRICVFVVPAVNNMSLTELEEQMLAKIKTVLPPYMVPAVVKALDHFPLLSSGKIDRKSLLDLLIARKILAPANELEEEVLTLWKELLGDKPISTEESFLTIGGNSISLMKLIGRIYRTFKVKMGLHELFSNLTIQQQAAFIQNANRNELFVIKQAASKASYNLSSVQERLYFEYELNPGGKAYNIPTAWEVTREYSLQKINAVINEITERHESLRTEFRVVDGRPQQIIKDKVTWEIEETDIGDDHFPDVFESFIQPFDLSEAPLARCKVVANARGQKILLLDIHHIVCDGRSQQTLLADFEKLYSGRELQAPRFQFKDFAEWEFSFRNSDVYLNQREFWLKKFEDDIPELAIPSSADYDDLTEEGDVMQVRMEVEGICSIPGQIDQKKPTHFSVTLSIYYLFLCELTGQDDIVLGIISEGRTQTELEGVIGMFVKTLPLRARIDMDKPYSAFVSELHEDFLQSHSHQSYDLSNIISELNKHRRGQVGPLFQSSFDYIERAEMATGPGNESIFKSVFKAKTDPKFPITLSVIENKDEFIFNFEYSLRYFTAEDMQMLADRFIKIASKVVSDPQAKVIDILGGASESQLMEVESEDISFDL